MELQARSNGFKSEDEAPQIATSITQALPQITEFAAESSLSSTAVLNNHCDVCSQNLRACIAAIEHAVLANGNTLEKVRLRDLQTRLQEHEIRFEVWKADCSISDGWLSVIQDVSDGSLYRSIDNLFIRMHETLKSLFSQMRHLQGLPIEASSSEEDDSRANFDSFDQAEQCAQTACDTMTRTIHDLAELQPNIQMAQAVYLGQGPYANIRETVDQISRKYPDDGAEDDEGNKSESAVEKEEEPTSGEQRCPKCKQSVPYHALAYHTNSCSGPIESPFLEPQFSDNTLLGGSEEQGSQKFPDIEIPTLDDISEAPWEYRIQSSTAMPTNMSKRRKPDHGTKAEKDGEDVYNYVDRIVRHSQRAKHSAYAGENYVRLANYLQKTGSGSEGPPISNKFAFMQEANVSWKNEMGKSYGAICTYDTHGGPKLRESLSSPQQVSSVVQGVQADGGAVCLIFLCGNPPPLMLAGLAVACHLDPEFLRRHLSSLMESDDYRGKTIWSIKEVSELAIDGLSQSDDLTLPSLPSTSKNIVQLRYTSIGRKIPKEQQPRQGWPGKSIVRDSFSCGEDYLCIEQQISMCVEQIPGKGDMRGSWLAFVWDDSVIVVYSSDYSAGPWLDDEYVKSVPTIPFRRKIALEDANYEKNPEHRKHYNSRLFQTCYGENLNPGLKVVDAFYAFHEIFEACAFSELQFLNLMEKQVNQYWAKRLTEYHKEATTQGDPTLVSLERTRMHIEEHVHRLQATRRLIQHRGDPQWPRATAGKDVEKAEAAARQLEEDFHYLVDRARIIRDKYLDLIGHLHASQKAIPQTDHNLHASQEVTPQTDYTKPVIALVLIAFLIFTTSFFSMNFKELQNISVWIYFVVSTPLVLGLTAVFSLWSKLSNFGSPVNRTTERKEPSTSMRSELEKKEERAISARFHIPGLYRRRTTLPV